MVKKFKAMPDKSAASGAAGFDGQLASAIKDSAQQIWLAGLGAFAKAQGEGTKMFEGLVKEGNGIQKMTRKLAEHKVGDVTGKVTKVAGEISKQATEGWDKLEQVFEDRVARAQKRMGVPTAKDIQTLTDRITALEAKLGGKPAARKTRPANKSVKAQSTQAKTAAVKSVKAIAKVATKAAKKAGKKVIRKVAKVAK
jgi:poly(hydroxyalkanoate) granule-associated protein